MASSPETEDTLGPEEEDLQTAICRLTSTERNIITDVLQRDKELRSQEKQRLGELKKELDEIKEKGLPEGEENQHGRVCVRCQGPLGLFSNRGEACPWCMKRVCKNCKRPVEKSWLCVLCFKEREIKGETGEWFYGSLAKKRKHPYGSTLLKKLIKRRKSQAYKLSKSRHKSEDSLELEYAIAETFGEDTTADRKYVLVDKNTAGSISVSEGNLVSYRHFGSEAAAARSSVIERHSSEAGLNDVAFTGDSLNDFEREAESPVDELQGADAVVNDDQREKRGEKKKVTLVVQANPFIGDDDDDDSETEESVENREMPEAEEPSSPVPPKPVRGILRSREDLSNVSAVEEISPKVENSKSCIEVVEPSVSEQKTVEKCKQEEESLEASEEDKISSLASLQREIMTNVENNVQCENEIWKEEFQINSRSASPAAAQPREIAGSARNSQEVEYGESERGNEDFSEDIVNFQDDANVNVDSIKSQDTDNMKDLEERNEVSFDQMAENKGTEEVAAAAVNADSSDPKAIPSASHHGIQDDRIDLQENLSGAIENELLFYEKADDYACKLECGETSSRKISRNFSSNKYVNHNGNEMEGREVVKTKSQKACTIRDFIVEDKSDERITIETSSLSERSYVSESVPKVEEVAVKIKVPEDEGEKPLSVKERMKFYREKEVESGVGTRYERGFATSRHQTITSNRAEIGVTKEFFFEDKRKHSEEIRPGDAKEKGVKNNKHESLSEGLDRKEETRSEIVELEKTVEILSNKSLEKEDEPEEICPIRGNSEHSPEAYTCEYNEKEIERKSDPCLKNEEKADPSLDEEMIADVENHVSKKVSIDHMLIDNYQDSNEDADLIEEGQTSKSASNDVLLKEDIPIVKVDICKEEHEASNEASEEEHEASNEASEEEHEASNEASENLLVNGEHVKDVIVYEETETTVTFNYKTEKTNGHVEDDVFQEGQSLSDDAPQSLEDDVVLPLKDQLKAESNQSIGSHQSEVDLYDTLRPELKVAGQIVLGLKYDHNSQQFEIQIHKAVDLIAVDAKKNTSDPYVKTYLLENDVRSNKKKTKAKKQTLNPVFDEIITYKLEYERLIEKIVVVSVWHNDMFGQNVFLGESQIVIADYLHSGYSLEDPTPQQYQLAERRLNRSDMKDVGEIVLDMKYIPPGTVKPQGNPSGKTDPVSGQLVVRCVEGKSLNGTVDSNPFCELRFVSVKSKGKRPTRTTDVEAKTINPYWDQEITFDNVTFNDLSNSVLEVRVLDASVGKKAKFLGAVRLGSGTSDKPFDDPSIKESTAWQKLLQEPKKGVTSTLALRSTLGSLKSSASLAPILVEREEDIKYQVREKKSDSILSQASTSSFTDDTSSLRGTLTKSKLKPQPDQYSLQSFGSMLSIYSDAGGYGSVPISGEMLFSIMYDNIAGVFEIHVQKAKGIAAVNKKTRASDPYVKTYLLPDKSKESKKKTNFKRKTVNPEWNEKIKYKIGEKEMMSRTLQVSIWNHEKFGHNDFLGEVQVQIQQYVKSGHNLNVHEPIWYTLQESAPVSVGEAVYKGSITVGLKFDEIDGTVGKLMVDIRNAKDLSSADPAQLSNPFVKSYLLPDRTRKSKRKSTFKKGTLGPVWNEKFEYSGVSLEELEHRVLELTVWDHDMHTNDFLGGARLGLERGDEHWHDCMGKEVSVWNAMLEHPGIWVEYTIPLRDSMTSRKGMDVKIPDIPEENDLEPAREPEAVADSNSVAATMPFTKTGNNIDSKIKIDFSAPLIRVGLMFVTNPDQEKKKKGTLRMMLRGARNLPLVSNGEAPSTYCKCNLKPSRMSWRTKTELFKRSAEPSWESLFEFEDIDDLNTKCAEVVICNVQNEEIGLVRLGPGLMQESWDDSVGREKEIWIATMENPDTWNYLLVPIRMKTEREESSRKIKIEEPRNDTEVNASSKTEEITRSSAATQEHKLSAKELALQSMGSHATSVRGSGQKSTVEDKSTLRSRNQSQENLIRTLSLIKEEDDGESQSRVRFVDEGGNASETERSKVVVPDIVVSKEVDTPAKSNEIKDRDVDIDAMPDVPSNLKKMSKFGSRDSISSMTSVYSTTSLSGTMTIPIRGSILFGMVYDKSTSTFQIHIFKASNIAAVDVRKEVSDPYVKCYLLPDKSKATKKKTKVRYKTINPEWNEIIEYRISLPDLRTKTLMVSIWNFDRLGRNIFLGEVLSPMAEKIDQGVLKEHSSIWYELDDMKSAKSPIVYKGRIAIALRFEDHTIGVPPSTEKKDKKNKKEKKKKKEKGRIYIHVIKGEDLPAGDDNGLSDPYCKFYLLPLRQSKTKRKTPVIRRTREAFWDYQTEYDVDFDELPELGIEFLVYDWDKSSRNDFLGCARLNLGGRTGKWDDAVGVEREAWQKLINEPNVRHEFVIPLRSSTETRPLEE